MGAVTREADDPGVELYLVPLTVILGLCDIFYLRHFGGWAVAGPFNLVFIGLTAALMAKYPSCEIGAYYAIMRSARILDDLERIGVPGVVAAYAHPAAASGWGLVVLAIRQHYAGHAAQVLALAAQPVV